MANVWQPIDNGQIQSAARFYTITVAAGGVYTLNSPFNVCKCIASNQSSFKVAWSSQAGETDFAQGWKVRFETVIPYVQIFNHSGSALTITLGVGIGDIDDSSFVLSNSQINTVQEPFSSYTSNIVTIGAGGSVTVQTLGYKLLVFQNTGSGTIKIGGANGIQLKPFGVMEYPCTGSVIVTGTPNETFTVGRFK